MPPATRSWATRASTTRIDEGRAPGALLQEVLALTHARSPLHPEAAEAGRPAGRGPTGANDRLGDWYTQPLAGLTATIVSLLAPGRLFGPQQQLRRLENDR
jgi:hypothetical protein